MIVIHGIEMQLDSLAAWLLGCYCMSACIPVHASTVLLQIAAKQIDTDPLVQNTAQMLGPGAESLIIFNSHASYLFDIE